MNFRELYDKYKVAVFVVYAMMICVPLVVIKGFLFKLILVLPLIALGVFLILDYFRDRDGGFLSVVSNDGQDDVIVTDSAVKLAVKNACKASEIIEYQSCAVFNTEAGLVIRLRVKILNSKVTEVADVIRGFIKKLVEEELNIKVDKINLIVTNTVYNLSLNKVSPTAHDQMHDSHYAVEKKAVYDENSQEYTFSYGNEKKAFKVPSYYVVDDKKTEENVTLPKGDIIDIGND